jgi:hypothetical protein
MSASEVFTTLTSFSASLTLSSARQQVVGDGELDEVHGLALDVGELVLALQDHGVVAVREVADDDGRGIDAAGRRDRQRVHVGDGDGVEGARRVLVDALDVVVELLDLDREPVLVGPLLHDAAFGGVAPRHPADVDRPRDLEVLLGGGTRLARREGERGQGREGHAEGCETTSHDDLLFKAFVAPRPRVTGTSDVERR